jgi:hypothetical protein
VLEKSKNCVGKAKSAIRCNNSKEPLEKKQVENDALIGTPKVAILFERLF